MDERLIELARTTPFPHAGLRGAWDSYWAHYVRFAGLRLWGAADVSADMEKAWAHFVNLIHACCRFGDATPLYGAMALEAQFGIS